MKSSLTIATIFGAGFFLSGVFMYILWPILFHIILNWKLVLAPDSSSYQIWEVTPIPMYIHFYLFNWTNPEDIIYKTNGSVSRPNLVELGPYVFRERKKKVIEHWCDSNGTVTFLQNRTWFFEPEMSKGSLDDLVTTVNIPAVTAAFALRHENAFYKSMLAAAMSALDTKLHVTKPAREFLFDGYSDPLLDLASIVPPTVAPVQIPFDKFGWFYSRNGSATYDGVFNMYTGSLNSDQFGQLGAWNYMTHTNNYEADCGKVRGSAGEFFPPSKKKEEPLSLFNSDICGTLTLTFKEETIVDSSIQGYRYWGGETMFGDKTKNPENWCFCKEGADNCPPSGSIDVSSCKFGAPAFISSPHFFLADESYREAVVGMKPNESLHQIFIDIEPISGIPLQVSAAMQINILVQPVGEYSFLKDAPKIYFPILWFKQTAHIDDDMGRVVHMVSLISSIGPIVSLVMVSAGFFGVATCLAMRMGRRRKDFIQNPSPILISNKARSFPSASKVQSIETVLQVIRWKEKLIPSENERTCSNIGNEVDADIVSPFVPGRNRSSLE